MNYNITSLQKLRKLCAQLLCINNACNYEYSTMPPCGKYMHISKQTQTCLTIGGCECVILTENVLQSAARLCKGTYN